MIIVVIYYNNVRSVGIAFLYKARYFFDPKTPKRTHQNDTGANSKLITSYSVALHQVNLNGKWSK